MNKKVVFLVGPTGSGKTALGVELALAVGGEVISADSRAIYRGMDIGAAKPTPNEMRGVPHGGIDLVEPDERFTVADYKEYCIDKIKEIQGRGHLPIIVGGTGLYVDAVVFDYRFNSVVKNTQQDRQKKPKNFIQVGVKINREDLRVILTARAEKMLSSGVVEETKELVRKGYDWGLQSMRSNIYPVVWRMIRGEISPEEAVLLVVKEDMDLAKRQMTWFKRNSQINWLPREEVAEYIKGQLGVD